MRARSGLLYEFCEPSSVVTRRLGARVAVLECTGRVYTVNISMNLRCARWSLMASQTDLRRGMRFRSVLSLSPLQGDTTTHFEAPHREYFGVARLRWTILSRRKLVAKSDASALGSASRSSVNRHFIRGGDAENSNWSRVARARFNWTDFGDISAIF